MRVNFLLLILVAVIFITFPFILKPPSEPLPILGVVKRFELSDSHGSKLDTDSLKGKPWLANFFFTSCQGICPEMTANLRKIFRLFPDSSDLNLVSISVDPKRDTPEALNEYAKRFEIDSARWRFLTGPIEEIKRISVESFMIGTFDDPSIHSDRIVLVDQAGNIRGFFQSRDEESLAELRTRIQELVG